MTRRFIITSLVCLGGLLVGCGGSDSPQATTTESPTTVPVADTAAVDTVPVDTVAPDTVAPDTTASPEPTDTDVAANADLPAWGECPDAVFPDLSAVEGAGDGYDMPAVAVACTDTELVVTSNGMPGYTFEPMTPNDLRPLDYVWTVPLQPTVADEPTSIVDVLGSLGFSVTGIPIYGPTEGPQPVAEAFGDPVYNGLLDSCGGHTGFAAEYHYHALHSDAACNLDTSFILGYALDGFPIYNSVGCLDLGCTETAVFVSGYQMTGDPTSYSWKAYTYDPGSTANVLDECNGRVGPDGTYRYHATSGFPYTFGCLAGTPSEQSGLAAEPMPAMTTP